MKILTIEDNPDIVDFISLAVEVGSPGTKIVATDHGSEGIKLVEQENPDIVLIDIGLPDMCGFDVIQEIRRFCSVPIICITVRSAEVDIVKGLTLGADDYIVKPFGQMELLARIRSAVRRRTGFLASEPLIFGNFHLAPESGILTFKTQHVTLTRTERHILNCLMTNAGNVISYNHLASAIWGEDYPNSTNTIKVYIRRLRKKIEELSGLKDVIKSYPTVGYAIEKR